MQNNIKYTTGKLTYKNFQPPYVPSSNIAYILFKNKRCINYK